MFIVVFREVEDEENVTNYPSSWFLVGGDNITKITYPENPEEEVEWEGQVNPEEVLEILPQITNGY